MRGDLWKGVYHMWRATEVAMAYPMEDAKLGTSIPHFFLLYLMFPLTKSHLPTLHTTHYIGTQVISPFYYHYDQHNQIL